MTTTAVIMLNVVSNMCQNVFLLHLVARQVFSQLLAQGCLFFLGLTEIVIAWCSATAVFVSDPCFALVMGISEWETLYPQKKMELARLVQSSVLEPGQENLAGRIQILTRADVQLKWQPWDLKGPGALSSQKASENEKPFMDSVEMNSWGKRSVTNLVTAEMSTAIESL